MLRRLVRRLSADVGRGISLVRRWRAKGVHDLARGEGSMLMLFIGILRSKWRGIKGCCSHSRRLCHASLDHRGWSRTPASSTSNRAGVPRRVIEYDGRTPELGSTERFFFFHPSPPVTNEERYEKAQNSDTRRTSSDHTDEGPCGKARVRSCGDSTTG